MCYNKDRQIGPVSKQERAKAVNRFTLEFLNEFADVNGGIDWEKLLRFNSGKETYARAAKPATERVSKRKAKGKENTPGLEPS